MKIKIKELRKIIRESLSEMKLGLGSRIVIVKPGDKDYRKSFEDETEDEVDICDYCYKKVGDCDEDCKCEDCQY